MVVANYHGIFGAETQLRLVPEPFERVLKRVRGMSLEGGSEIEIRDYWPMSEAV